MTTHTATGEGDVVATLFAERQRFEGWLAALEERRASTPAHIYDRVKTDYQSRLNGVMDELRAKRAEVESRANSIANRIGELETEARRYEDERAEIDLRAAIGEIESERAESTRREADQRLMTIGSERNQLEGDLRRLREILVASAEAPAPVSPAPAIAHVPPAGVSAEAPPAPQKDASTAFDELEFLKSVTDSRGVRGGLATAESAVEAERKTTTARPTPRNGTTSGSVPVFLRDVPAEQTKTLKCQECGTMNYPTEWYCERCGAELAAL